MRLLVPICAALITVGCGVKQSTGSGTVRGNFELEGCRSNSDDPELFEYDYDVGRLATERFEDVLIIVLQEFSVELEQTDGLRVRLPDVDELRTLTERPILLPLTREQNRPNATLSLFQTCPNRPQLFSVAGTLSLTKFTVNERPEDTGIDEVIAGTLTATVSSADDRVVGTIFSEFDFLPPRSPLSDFRSRS